MAVIEPAGLFTLLDAATGGARLTDHPGPP